MTMEIDTGTREIAANLADDERRIIAAMSDELGYSAARLSEDAGEPVIPVKRVREIQRAFKANGLAEFGVLHDLDSNHVAGRGYWLNAHGWNVRRVVNGG